MGSCEKCVVMDDNLNILPLSSHAANITAVEVSPHDESSETTELKLLQESLQDTQPVGVLVNCCKTLDQVMQKYYPPVWWCVLSLKTVLVVVILLIFILGKGCSKIY